MKRLDAKGQKIVLAILVPALFFLSLVTWGFSSPVGSSPDDDFHLASIWCGAGEREGLCEIAGSADSLERSVPTVIDDSMCSRFLSDTSGSCFDPESSGLVTVPRANIDNLYPPLFYATMSIFASPDVAASVVAIRIANALLFVSLLTVLFFALPRRVRPALVISAVTTLIPLGLFIIPSTNPSSWAILSAAMVWISVYGATQTRGRQRVALLVLAAVGAALGIGARADAAIFAVFGAGIGLLLGVRWRSIKDSLSAIIVSAVIAVGSAVTYLSTVQGGAIIAGIMPERAPFTPLQQVENFLEVPLLWTGVLGGWGLGWLDTPLPSAVWVFNALVCGGAVFLGLQTAGWRRALTFGVAFAAMWLVPAYLLSQSRVIVGEIIQPRYILPLIIIAIGVASLRFDAARVWRGVPSLLAIAALAATNAISLHQLMKRYTTGVDVPSINPGYQAEWWWPVIPSPLATWIIGMCAFGAALVGLWFAARSPVSVVGTVIADVDDSRDQEVQAHATSDGTASTDPVEVVAANGSRAGTPGATASDMTTARLGDDSKVP